MTLPTTRGRRAALGLVTLGLVLVAAVAAAYWRASGAGAATASTRGTSALTIAPGSPTAQLYPGGQATVVLTLSNPNPSAVRIGSLALDTGQGTAGFAVDAGHSTCGLGALSFATQTNGGAGWTVPASGTLPLTLTNSLSMTAAAANGCQGATFTVYLKAAA